MTKEHVSRFLEQTAVWAEVIRAEFLRRINRLSVSDSRRVAASHNPITTAELGDDGWVELSIELDDGTAIDLGRLSHATLA